MKKLLPLLLVGFLYADNEVYIDQSGNNANIDIEQLGSSNIIGGLNAVSGTMTALDLDGLNLTLDIPIPKYLAPAPPDVTLDS